MQIALFKDIVYSLAGSGAVKIIDLLYDKKNVNEFLIAKKLKLTINQTRNLLYKLADEGLVSFVRKKDSKKGGWYTYFWTLNIGKSLVKFRDKLNKQVQTLELDISNKKKNQFFICPSCKMNYTSEQALLEHYSCPECGEVLQLKDNTGEIQEMEKQLSKMQKVLEEINGEISVIEKEEEKVKGRRLKAEAKKKEKERALRRKEKAKLAKKLGKGKAKKGTKK
jgi:transcription factor E